MEAYAGQWVALEGEKVIAHGDDVPPVLEEARNKGIQVPLILWVEPEPVENAVRMGL